MIYSTSQRMMTLLREGRAHSTNPARANMECSWMNAGMIHFAGL
jgi:hypothetical protein